MWFEGINEFKNNNLSACGVWGSASGPINSIYGGSSMKRKVTKAIFPVAGLGTRFLPATKSIPKEIMTLVDRPLI